jgi:hypothetical protein
LEVVVEEEKLLGVDILLSKWEVVMYVGGEVMEK